MRRLRLLSALLAVCLLLSLITPGMANTAGTSPPPPALVSQIDIDRAMDHLHHLTEVIGARVRGTPEERAAAMYLAAELESYGYEIAIETFAPPNATLNVGYVELQTPGGVKKLQMSAAANGLISDPTAVTGEIVYAGTGVSDDDYPADVTGKIVALTRQTNVNAQVQKAVSKGATAVILFGTTAGVFAPSLNPAQPIPVVGGSNYQGDVILELLADGALTGSVRTARYGPALQSQNVIATKKAAVDPDNAPIVYVMAHYDSVLGAPGANDDGSGTVLVLELARLLAAYPTDKEIRFALWGAEEAGLRGSIYHVDQLSAADRARVAAAFQNDMVGTAWEPAVTYWLLPVDGNHNTATRAVYQAAIQLGYADIINMAPRGSSDHVPFHNAGIASANFSWRGANSPAQLEPDYHNTRDNIELNISPERLRKSMEFIGTAVHNLAASGAALPPPAVAVTSPSDGTRVGTDVLTVTGAAIDALGLQSVTVNGRRATLGSGDTFTAKVALQPGPNQVTVVATNKAGMQSTETLTVDARLTAPTATELVPATDIELTAGETVTLRFTAETGLTAAYQIVLNGAPEVTRTKGAALGQPLAEVSPGVYEAVYTAPAHTEFSGALIRFNVADEFHNLLRITAPGSLSVRP